jgi:hypothetical protein
MQNIILPLKPKRITSSPSNHGKPNQAPNWETIARLAFTPSKLLDLDVCPASTSLHRFCGATDKLKSAWF